MEGIDVIQGGHSDPEPHTDDGTRRLQERSRGGRIFALVASYAMLPREDATGQATLRAVTVA